jgi:hypothetical protein
MQKQAQAAASIASAHESIVQRFAVLDGAVTAFKPTLSLHKQLRDEILSWTPTLAPDASHTHPGETFDVLVTPCDNERRVTVDGKRKLWKLWRMDVFMERCGVTLSRLPDPHDPAKLYTVMERIGPRHLKPIPRAA